ncbi:MAG: hypothetical protein ACRC6Y_03115, partial [Cetobacterium sp.]
MKAAFKIASHFKYLQTNGQIAVLSTYREKQLDLDTTDLSPTSRASVLLPFTFKKFAESQSLISAKQLDKDGGGKESTQKNPLNSRPSDYETDALPNCANNACHITEYYTAFFKSEKSRLFIDITVKLSIWFLPN